ncbi:hypothetical protein COI_0704 [Mannheimia haemolytica serotype A2 str. OVINE]|nr:hypothetical protein AU484_gp75 [Mannheimia phage vB_MhS_587AP2]AJA73028.1 hypothetical protein 587AP2_53 [Mannheimia phage vB_MhS_587AP2]EEY10656.1 hypothetical protein COI_0704 [Mannheimia haemolytica serotype A2 str. OVINE]
MFDCLINKQIELQAVVFEENFADFRQEKTALLAVYSRNIILSFELL